MRLMPRSFTGQLALLLVLALLVAQVAAILIYSHERLQVARDMFQESIVERTAAILQLLEDAPEELHFRMLDTASSPFFRFSTSAQARTPRQETAEAELAARTLARQLGIPPRRVIVALGQGARESRWPALQVVRMLVPGVKRPDPRNAEPPYWLRVSIAMRNGSWLNLAVGPPPGPPPFGRPFLISLVLSSLATLAVAMLVAGRMARPMRRLADAADRLGRGEQVEPLPETGPDEARRTVRAFNTMRERLGRFVSDRTTMLAAISHDLRTPLTSLRLRAEMVEDEETRDRLVETIEEMRSMSDATLAFVRADQAGEETRAVDLAALAESVVEDLAELGQTATLEEGDHPVVRCRPVAVKRALRNLVENAVRYGRDVRVVVTGKGGEAVIRVSDRGPGLPPEDLDRVFEPFVRGETSRNRETGGLGLGLAIARTIARSHGGDIRLRNRPEGGLEATLSIPVST